MLQRFFRTLLSGATQLPLSEFEDLVSAKRFDEAEARLPGLVATEPNIEALREALAAELAFHRGQDGLALEGAHRVLADEPGHPWAHYVLSLVLVERGDLETAVGHVQYAHNARPRVGKFSSQYGYALLLFRQPEQAETALRKALSYDRSNAHAWNNYGIVAIALGRKRTAQRRFRRALQLKPDFIAAQDNLRKITVELVDDIAALIEDVLESSEWAIVQDDEHMTMQPWWPELTRISAELHRSSDSQTHTRALNNLDRCVAECFEDEHLQVASARILFEHSGLEDAMALLELWLAQYPDSWRAHYWKAALLHTVGEHMAATKAAQHAVEFSERQFDALLLHATAGLKAKGMAKDMLPILRELYALRPTKRVGALLCGALNAVGQYDEVLNLVDQMEHDQVMRETELLVPKASAQLHSGDLETAKATVDKLLRFSPNNASILVMKSFIDLAEGRFAEGWPNYRMHHYASTVVQSYRALPFPRWQGEEVAGKSVLILADQGLGDQIMFGSCIKDLVRAGPKRVIVEVHQRLFELLRRSFDGCEVVSSGQKGDFKWLAGFEIDCYARVSELAQHFRQAASDFDGLPFLQVDAAKAQRWREHFSDAGKRLVVGVSWKGGAEETRTHARSIAALEFARGLKAFHNVQFVALQYGDALGAVEAIRSAGLPIEYWAEGISDLDEFGALVSELDAVVSVCNTTIHVSGALGIPTFVLAPKMPEWRYGARGTKMVWYNSVQVHRQQALGEWSDLLASAATWTSSLTKKLRS
jgi:Flp pilus assembly protein TadD